MKNDIDSKLTEYVNEEMVKRGFDISEVANNVYELQKRFSPEIVIEDCLNAVYKVLGHRDILQLMAVAFQLDNCANENHLDTPLQDIIASDRGEFGVDEIIAMAMCAEYGPIAITTFGNEDTHKHGAAKKLDIEQKNGGSIATFADDIYSALVACSAAKLAHDEENKRQI